MARKAFATGTRADVNALNANNKTPLDLAYGYRVEQRNKELLQILIDASGKEQTPDVWRKQDRPAKVGK